MREDAVQDAGHVGLELLPEVYHTFVKVRCRGTKDHMELTPGLLCTAPALGISLVPAGSAQVAYLALLEMVFNLQITSQEIQHHGFQIASSSAAVPGEQGRQPG